jgi:hypothetical protein
LYVSIVSVTPMETRVWATAKRGMPADVSRLVIAMDKTDFQFLRII